jgi:hypothetical protein
MLKNVGGLHGMDEDINGKPHSMQNFAEDVFS